LGDLPARLGCYGIADMVCVRRKEYDVACNWKVLIENSMEELHISTVHRKTIQRSTPTEVHAPEETKGQCALLFARHEGSMALLKGDTGVPRIKGLTGKAAEGTHFALIFPAATMTLTIDGVTTGERRPIGPGRTLYVHSLYFPRETVDSSGFEDAVAHYFKRWDTTIPEDVEACERQQRGLRSPISGRGRFSYRETLVHQADNWWLDRVLGAAQ
jgi:phenylpropionate dioxygenase-like ring-hydroxylating dioxygenase large terminal subunit